MATAKGRNEKGTDAIALLTQDHEKVKKLFKSYQKLVDNEGEDSEKEAIASEICMELTVHARIEEEIFYPAVRQAIDEEGLMDEADVEHATAKDLIAQIQASAPSEDHYDAKVIVLGEYIDHHVKEEQNEMFPKARKKIDVNEVGEELAKRKDELLADVSPAGEKGPKSPRSPAGKSNGPARRSA